MKVSMAPLLFILQFWSVNVNCQADLVAPYVTLEGSVLQNHSYINFSQIGNSISDGVQCHTDLTTCCNSSYGSHGGRWHSYATADTLNNHPGGNNPLYQREFYQGLAILSDPQSQSSDYLNRLHRCDIDTNASTDGGRNDTNVSLRESVYVGIYTTGGYESLF